MAEYKAKQSSGTLYKGDFKIKWATANQDELAYAYEELGLTSLVEKISTTTKKNEAKKTDKKKYLLLQIFKKVLFNDLEIKNYWNKNIYTDQFMTTM